MWTRAEGLRERSAGRGRRIGRRAFMVGGLAASLAGRAAHGQDGGRTYRLGILTGTPRTAPAFAAFFDELREAGFIEGRNLSVDHPAIGAAGDEVAPAARDLVASGVDAIFTGGNLPARMAQEATRTIPIVGINDDMIAEGLVRSLAHPESNITGISILAPELDGKRQELLIEAAPAIQTMAAIADTHVTSAAGLQALQDGARARGVELLIYHLHRREEIGAAIDAARRDGAGALNMLATPLVNANLALITDHLLAAKLPAIFQWPDNAEAGGLMAYGPRHSEVYRQIARLLVKIFHGAKPSDLPIEQPARFELVINLKTAKSIEFQVPPALLARADEVIE
jgi:putative ABC transport system substrate-binding protein